jgi:hypothetical protein
MYKKRIRDRLEYNKYRINNNYQKDTLFIWLSDYLVVLLLKTV